MIRPKHIWTTIIPFLVWTTLQVISSERLVRTAALLHSQPWFISKIENVTVPQGRDARLSCSIENLGEYKVAWIYKGPPGGRTILTAATQTVTKNPRISAYPEGSAWVLYIKGVTKKDEGTYLCQVNTKPPTSQNGYLSIVVPPVIDDATSSNDVIADEENDVTLMCDARGDPEPQISWKREHGKPIRIPQPTTDGVVLGRILTIRKVTREDAGAYLCIATNGIPPSISKRMILDVNFPPRILQESVADTSCGVVIATDLNLTCRFKARPRGKVKWFRGSTELVPNPPFNTIITRHGQDSVSWISNLSLRLQNRQDFGSFHCVVENRLGKDKSSFRVYEVTTTSTTTLSTTTMEISTTRAQATWLNKVKFREEFGYGTYGSQPPLYPWYVVNETSTKTNKNRFVQEEKISNIERRKKTQSHTEDSQGSFFGTSSSLSHVLGSWRLSALLGTLFIMQIICL